MPSIRLTPGARYYAGVDLPWFVPRSAVDSRIMAMGGSTPVWHEGSDPTPVNPRLDPGFKPAESWIDVVYHGPDQTVELPAKPNWLIMVPPDGGQLATSPVSPEQSNSAITPAKASKNNASTGIALAVGAVALDILIFGSIVKVIRRKKTVSPEQKKGSVMSPLVLLTLGGAGVALLIAANKGKPTIEEINARYTAAMNAPTSDWAYYDREIQWLVAQGQPALANNVALRVEKLKSLVNSTNAANAAKAAAQAAAKA